MQIDTTDVKAIFSFTSRTHILVHENNEWTINPRIENTFAEPNLQNIGRPIIYLTDSEAEALKKSGFTYTER